MTLRQTTRQTSRRAALAGAAALLTLPSLGWSQRQAPVIAPLSAADKALVDSAVAYLQGLTNARGRFQQTDPRGRVSEGEFFLKRPGKFRFAYEAPNDILMISDGNRVSIHNRRLGTFDQWPLLGNPLSIFLAKEIRLDRGIVISEVKRFADGFSITARDGKKEAEGQVVLVFGGAPLALREWTTIDAQGGRTRIALSGLSRPAALDNALFVARNPNVRPARARPN